MDNPTIATEDARQQISPESPTVIHQEQNFGHSYPTRRSASTIGVTESRTSTPPLQLNSIAMDKNASLHSPLSPSPRNVSFELLFEGGPKGRLSLRVQIWPHDTTESIVTTVKNFFGLYDGGNQGISFEDGQGNTLIASYDNFSNGMVVFVRVISDVSSQPEYPAQWGYRPSSPQRIQSLEEKMPLLPPQPAQILNYGQAPVRPDSRVSHKQSNSPKMNSSRILPSQKSRSRSAAKGQGSSFQAGLDELNDASNGYSSSDGGAGSVTSSRKARSELATAEISVDNIVEGGRRKRAKFESSELPLYVPPQVPAPNSISSVSPQRRSNGIDNPSPFTRPTQRTFTYSVPTQSPHAIALVDPIQGTNPSDSPFQIPAMPNHGHRLRDRTSGVSLPGRLSMGSAGRAYGHGILPTPDPTVASTISDEDVALQLMRLGEVSNFSHGRTSTSTLDDALSGRADAASSDSSNGESDSEDTDGPAKTELGPPPKKQKRSITDRQLARDYSDASGDEADTDYRHNGNESDKHRPKPLKIKKSRAGSASTKSSKQSKLNSNKKAKSTAPVVPMSPASVTPQSRKPSSASTINFQHQLGADEDDLSSKPRCQRCRKSKKGCDRQRPCQRCKDAGISVDGCVSEDEGNGRKGRYGRHMGVPVKKDVDGGSVDHEFEAASAILSGMAGGSMSPDGKSKKRKR